MQSVKLIKIIEKMHLKNLTPEIDISNILITQSDINRPALQLAGFFEHFDTDRVQVIGYVEYTYLQQLESARKTVICNKLLGSHIPCIVYCRSLEPEMCIRDSFIGHVF